MCLFYEKIVPFLSVYVTREIGIELERLHQHPGTSVIMRRDNIWWIHMRLGEETK